MDVPFPGGWRFRLSAIAGWLLFLALVAAAVSGRELGWPRELQSALALGPAVVAALQFYFAYRKVAGQDEFVRALFARRMLAAAALTVVIATAWSGLEIVGAPHLPAWLLYPLIWGLFGLLTPIIQGTRA